MSDTIGKVLAQKGYECLSVEPDTLVDEAIAIHDGQGCWRAPGPFPRKIGRNRFGTRLCPQRSSCRAVLQNGRR